jgi:hypothetical protein
MLNNLVPLTSGSTAARRLKVQYRLEDALTYDERRDPRSLRRESTGQASISEIVPRMLKLSATRFSRISTKPVASSHAGTDAQTVAATVGCVERFRETHQFITGAPTLP